MNLHWTPALYSFKYSVWNARCIDYKWLLSWREGGGSGRVLSCRAGWYHGQRLTRFVSFPAAVSAGRLLSASSSWESNLRGDHPAGFQKMEGQVRDFHLSEFLLWTAFRKWFCLRVNIFSFIVITIIIIIRCLLKTAECLFQSVFTTQKLWFLNNTRRVSM